MNLEFTVARRSENVIATALGAVLVSGVYLDGWAHLNLGGLETFFTPWHGALYGGFALLVASLTWMVWRRRQLHSRWTERVPVGYGWGWVGVAVFAAGGLGDMMWHLAFGIEAGVGGLVSPTHLLLLTGGVLLLTSPMRAVARSTGEARWPAVISLSSATALAGFFLGYVSVFADPGASEPLVVIPEGLPGHRAAQLPAIAGLGSYLVSTVLLVVPVLYLRRRNLLPFGSVAVVVGAVAIPAAALGQLLFLAPAAVALVGAALVDLVLAIRPELPDTVVAGLFPALVWSGQLVGMAGSGNLRWPPELWAGVLVLTVLLAVMLTWLMAPARPVSGAAAPQNHQRWALDVPSSVGPGQDSARG
jgi:hypothetical protein